MIKSPTTRVFFLIFCSELKLCSSYVLSLYECKSLLGPLPEYHRRAAYVQLLHSLPPSTAVGGKSMAGKREDPSISTSLCTSLSSTRCFRTGRGLGEAKTHSCSLDAAGEPLLRCTGSPHFPQNWQRTVASCQGDWGATPPASRFASPLAFCFTRLDVLLTLYNVKICCFPSINGNSSQA